MAIRVRSSTNKEIGVETYIAAVKAWLEAPPLIEVALKADLNIETKLFFFAWHDNYFYIFQFILFIFVFLYYFCFK